ncbi:MAG: class I SAM-dependent methyltransferase [Planctomycetota bacterium]|nr:class I SAM-dependent methyltransferase [Planctomycetota bacterium]
MLANEHYELIDFGAGRKLERFGGVILDRPSPAAQQATKAKTSVWNNPHARFQKITGTTGEWISRNGVENCWPWQFGPVEVELRTTPFGHVGIFPEQAENWHWLGNQLAKHKQGLRVLNLFAYTGVSSLVAAQCGADVVHLDAASNVVAWARHNAKQSGLCQHPIRWIVEDARKFTQRELRRGNRYDAVILDPPSYGHGPKGEPWQLTTHLDELLHNCLSLTAGAPQFLLLTCHTSGMTTNRMAEALKQAGLPNHGSLETARLTLPTSDGRKLASGLVARWSQ